MSRFPRSQRKPYVRDLLSRRQMGELARRAAADRRVLDALMSLLTEQDDLLRWRAVEAVGHTAAVLSRSGLEPVRELIRRLLWWMNEESGANVRHAPEALGEILARTPALIPEYASILASFLDEPFFRAGVHWALSRIAQVNPRALSDYVNELAESVRDEDPGVRAWAASALAAVDGERLASVTRRLAGDAAPVEFYDFTTGEIITGTVAQVAQSVGTAE